MPITILTEQDSIADALNRAGWIDGEVLVAGQLRQGKAPSMMGMITGTALIEVLRPRRSKKLPRHFVLALTADRAYAFKAAGGSGEDSSSMYKLYVREAIVAEFPRHAITLTDLPEGRSSKGGTMEIEGDRFPVSRPNLNGDPSTDALVEALAAGPRLAPDLQLMAS